ENRAPETENPVHELPIGDKPTDRLASLRPIESRHRELVAGGTFEDAPGLAPLTRGEMPEAVALPPPGISRPRGLASKSRPEGEGEAEIVARGQPTGGVASTSDRNGEADQPEGDQADGDPDPEGDEGWRRAAHDPVHEHQSDHADE